MEASLVVQVTLRDLPANVTPLSRGQYRDFAKAAAKDGISKATLTLPDVRLVRWANDNAKTIIAEGQEFLRIEAAQKHNTHKPRRKQT